MRDTFLGRPALALVTLGALVFAAGCGGGSGVVPSPSNLFGSNVNSCGAISGVTTGEAAIVNGKGCTPGTASVPLLSWKDKDDAKYICSGTVISSTAILTAAHCVADAVTMTIKFDTKEIAAESFSYSPDYNGTASDSIDVGVVIASSPLNQPIVPLLGSRDPKVDETVVVAGYGQELGGSGAGTLRAGATAITQVGSVFLQTQASLSNSGACPGDSGGPLLASENSVWMIVGITSTLAGPCVVGTNNFLRVRNATVRAFIASKVPDADWR